MDQRLKIEVDLVHMDKSKNFLVLFQEASGNCLIRHAAHLGSSHIDVFAIKFRCRTRNRVVP